MKQKSLSLLLLLFVLSACTSHWVSEDGNFLNSKPSEYFCEQLAEDNYPVKNEVAVRTDNRDVMIRCPRKEKKCKDQVFRYETRSQLVSYVIDVNANSRFYYFKQCMHEKGWKQKYQLLKIDDLL